MKILFLGDIVGYLGRQTAAALLPQLKKRHKPDIIIANAENAAHGKGVTENTIKELLATGIDTLTGGNHSFAKAGTRELFDQASLPLLRPANYPPGAPGSGEKVMNIGEKKLLLINLLGRVFMRELVDCPFRALDGILRRRAAESFDAILVDFHAEATSEKNAFARYADGRVTAVIGTHTHIPTADERVFANGTASITDVGAVMAHESVLGANPKEIIETFLTQIPNRHSFPRAGIGELNGVLITIGRNGTAKGIKRIREFYEVT